MTPTTGIVLYVIGFLVMFGVCLFMSYQETMNGLKADSAFDSFMEVVTLSLFWPVTLPFFLLYLATEHVKKLAVKHREQRVAIEKQKAEDMRLLEAEGLDL